MYPSQKVRNKGPRKAQEPEQAQRPEQENGPRRAVAVNGRRWLVPVAWSRATVLAWLKRRNK